MVRKNNSSNNNNNNDITIETKLSNKVTIKGESKNNKILCKRKKDQNKLKNFIIIL